MMVRERGSLDSDALLEALRAKVRAPGPGGDRDDDRIRLGRHAHRLRAVERERAQIARAQTVLLHAFLLCRVEFVLVVRNLHAKDLGRAEQTVRVVAQAKDRRADRGFVTTHAFEYTKP